MSREVTYFYLLTTFVVTASSFVLMDFRITTPFKTKMIDKMPKILKTIKRHFFLFLFDI